MDADFTPDSFHYALEDDQGNAIEFSGTYHLENKKPLLRILVTKKAQTVNKIDLPFSGSKPILASFFPLWVKLKAPSLKIGKKESFQAIVENNLEQNFKPVSGTVELIDLNPTKIRVFFVKEQIWQLDSDGIAIEIDIPSEHRVVKQTEQKKAQQFLD